MGGLSVFALLVFILVQTATGMFADDEYYYFAPLNKFISGSTAGTITEIHGINFNILVGFVILHVIAILFYKFYKKEKIIMAMITGKKIDEQGNYEAIPGSRLIAATLLAASIAGLVYWVVNYI
jgi:cytochrome b